MGPWIKFLVGALLTVLVGWLAYCYSGSGDDDGGDSRANTTAVAVAEQQAKSCQADINGILASKTIPFRSGSFYISLTSAETIKALAVELKKCANAEVEVQGHSDLSGSAETNKAMSQARAEAVVAELVKQGIPEARLTAKGYGSSQPLMEGSSSEANAKNRRTELKITAASAATEGGQ